MVVSVNLELGREDGYGVKVDNVWEHAYVVVYEGGETGSVWTQMDD